MKKPEYQRGRHRVRRWCCQSANCFMCLACGNAERRISVVQTDCVSKEWADYVAHNWRLYGATVEKMEGRQ